MKGLIIKDFINLKKNFRMMGLILVLYALITMTSRNAGIFTSVLTMVFAILVLSSYSYDDMANWDIYAQTLPISRDNIVLSKYIIMILLTLLGAGCSSVFTIVFHYILKTDQLISDFQSIAIGVVIIFLFYSLLIPFITKLGVEKARLIFFVIYVIPFAAIMYLRNLIEAGSLFIPHWVLKGIDFFTQNVYILTPVIVIVALAVSYMISVEIYKKKEF